MGDAKHKGAVAGLGVSERVPVEIYIPKLGELPNFDVWLTYSDVAEKKWVTSATYMHQDPGLYVNLRIRAASQEQADRRSRAPSGRMSGEEATVIALAQVLIEKGDTESAEKHLLPLKESGNGYAMLLLGMLLRDDGKNDEAAEMLRRAVDAGRNEGLTPLGMVLRDLGRLAEAEAVLAHAAEQQRAG